MKLKDYIIDKRHTIIFYFILMFFICCTIYFDRANRVLDSNIIYIITVSSIIFILYSAFDFWREKDYCDKLLKLMECENGDWVNNLPKSYGCKDGLFNKLLYKLYDDRNREIDRLNNSTREDIEFITAWVHEIKTPIAASKLLIESSTGCSNNKILESIQEEIDKIEDYVQKALYYSISNDLSKDYIICWAKPYELAKESIKRNSKSFIHKKISVEIDRSSAEVATDKKWMGFILDQILSNSIKYSNDGGCVKFNVQERGNETLLNIEDNGIGIKEEDISRVFDKSFTGTNGRNTTGSSGIGLYLSQKLANKLGHYITIQSVYGSGTIVTIHFPKLSDYYSVVNN